MNRGGKVYGTPCTTCVSYHLAEAACEEKEFLNQVFLLGEGGRGEVRRTGGGKVSGDKEGRGKELMKEMKALIAGAYEQFLPGGFVIQDLNYLNSITRI